MRRSLAADRMRAAATEFNRATAPGPQVADLLDYLADLREYNPSAWSGTRVERLALAVADSVLGVPDPREPVTS